MKNALVQGVLEHFLYKGKEDTSQVLDEITVKGRYDNFSFQIS